ncbi:MAG: ABC transporter ATP-binding protein [Cryobacterium sp.]|nr:ABC transporter ATP-binding protein [Cryobacterium sp.]MBX3103985.1 ABC transporter ATP-binding protein [Cryobacterium sp.]
MKALLEVLSLEVSYGSRQIIWDFSIDVSAGQISVLLGPNGAGKTTLAKAIAGSLPILSGDVLLDDKSLLKVDPEGRARRGLIHVPQGRRVFADLTVQENLSVARFAAGSRLKEQTLDFVYELFPKLSELGHRHAGSLSGGEQQMLAVGRAIMAEPRVLILDEPSLGLSPLMVESLYGAITKVRSHGVGVLLIEQMVGAALAVADHVTVLQNGRVATHGDAESFRSSKELLNSYLGGGNDK